MKMINTIMPLMSAYFCFLFPIGMGLYWIAGAVVRCVIQICVNKHLDRIDIDEMIKKNVEKNNEKRRKAGLPPQQINSNATISTRNVEKKEKTAEEKAKLVQGIKDSTEYYNKNAEKPGSLASKAAMVRHYNEKNNKN
jgi:YidC/Oxa1 family membrane protein insertase